MRQYKLAIHILVILSIFNILPVLAAPIPVRQVHEASGYHGPQTHPIQPSSVSRELQGRDAGQGNAPGLLGGTDLPWNSPGGLGRPQSGGTGLKWYSPNQPTPGTSVRTKPVPGIGPTSLSSGQTVPSKVFPLSKQEGYVPQTPTKPGETGLKWYSSNDPQRPKYSGGTELPWFSHNRPPPGTSVRTRPVPGIGPISPSSGQTVPSKVFPLSKQGGYVPQTPTKPGGTGLKWYLSNDPQRPKYSGGTELPWSSNNRPPPGTSVRTRPVPGVGPTSPQTPTKPLAVPQSKSSLSDLGSLSKTFAKLKFWRRISRTARRSRIERFTRGGAFLPLSQVTNSLT